MLQMTAMIAAVINSDDFNEKNKQWYVSCLCYRQEYVEENIHIGVCNFMLKYFFFIWNILIDWLQIMLSSHSNLTLYPLDYIEKIQVMIDVDTTSKTVSEFAIDGLGNPNCYGLFQFETLNNGF